MSRRQTLSRESERTVPNRAERRHPDRFASRPEVAEYLVVPVATLDQWAYRGTGPPYRIFGRHARYRWSDVDQWVAAQKTGGGDVA